MSRFTMRAVAIVAVAGTAAISLVGAGAAQASDASVRAAIKSAGKEIKESPELKKDLSDLRRPSKVSLQKGIKVFATFHADLEKAAKKVSAQSASTATGKEGEKDWLEGVKKVAAGFADFETVFRDIEHKSVSAAKKETTKAKKLFEEGTAEGKKGDKLLGVS